MSGVSRNGGWSHGGSSEDNGMMVEVVVAMVRKWDGECGSDDEGYGSESCDDGETKEEVVVMVARVMMVEDIMVRGGSDGGRSGEMAEAVA
ncbi:unnamed protein product [Malus baccata var. baccata]